MKIFCAVALTLLSLVFCFSQIVPPPNFHHAERPGISSSGLNLDFTGAVGVWGMGPDTGANDIPWWTAGANTGQRVWDFSSAANHLQLGSTGSGDTNDPTKVDAGYTFDGVDDYLTKSATLIAKLTNKTFTAVIKSNATSGCVYAESETGNNNSVFWLRAGGSQLLNIFIRDTGGIRLNVTPAGVAIFDNNWVSITFVDAAGSWKLYKNGVLVDSGSYTQATSWGLDGAAIGSDLRNPMGQFLAMTEATAIPRNVAMTDAQVASQYRVLFNKIGVPRGLSMATPTAFYRWERMGEWALRLPFAGPPDLLGVTSSH